MTHGQQHICMLFKSNYLQLSKQQHNHKQLPCHPADSMFVMLPGRSREQAFRIGAEIAKAVTAANPHPVALKMEKVHNCWQRW